MRNYYTFLLLVVFLTVVEGKDGKNKNRNSRFYWKRQKYVMPWLKGPNVCAVEEVIGTRKKYYSECMTYMPRQICGRPTYIRYHCCTGYEVEGNTEGCQGVAPVENLMNTAKHLYLVDFRKQAKRSDVVADRLAHGGAYTVFAPENAAFNIIQRDTRSQFGEKKAEKNLMSYYMVDGRYYTQDLINDMQLPTLYDNNATLRVNRYSNGIVTVNCARLILPNQPASNGILHVIDKVVEPIDAAAAGSVMEKALFDSDLGEFVTALVLTDVANTLRGSTGSFTIFAPTDEAFRKADPDLISRVLADNTLVEKLLRYHIIDSSICAAAILGPVSLETLEGQKVNLTCDSGGRIRVNDIPIKNSDGVAHNGVIHTINTLLVPDSVKTVGEMLNDLELFEFVEQAQGAGLGDILKQTSQNYTILAPNKDAFQALTREQKRLLRTSDETVRRVLSYHVIPGHVTTRQMVGDNSFEAFGSSGTINTHSSAKVYTKNFGINSARIVSSDHRVSNGVIQVVDQVLWPPTEVLLDELNGDPELSTFVSLLESSGLSKMLAKADQHFTIFAPTNAAFEAMENTILEQLMLDKTDLEIFLRNHMIHTPTYLRTMDDKWRYRYKTMAGEWIEMKRKSQEEPVMINEHIKVIKNDVHALNGVYHKVSSVFSCPCLDKIINDVTLF